MTVPGPATSGARLDDEQRVGVSFLSGPGRKPAQRVFVAAARFPRRFRSNDGSEFPLGLRQLRQGLARKT
jgi:hypothetical protein